MTSQYRHYWKILTGCSKINFLHNVCFRFFDIFKINDTSTVSFCNLLIERPSYVTSLDLQKCNKCEMKWNKRMFVACFMRSLIFLRQSGCSQLRPTNLVIDCYIMHNESSCPPACSLHHWKLPHTVFSFFNLKCIHIWNINECCNNNFCIILFDIYFMSLSPQKLSRGIM